MTPILAGFILASVAVLCYGSYFVPAKKYDIHDGIVYQWYQCSGILVTGVICAVLNNNWNTLAQASPGVYVCPEGLVSGMIFVLANCTANVSVKLCGLGNYYTLHQVTNLGLAFVVGVFGPQWGIPSKPPGSVTLAALGISLVLVGAIPVMCMEPEGQETPGEEPLISIQEKKPTTPKSARRSWFLGIVLSFIAGALYAGIYVPLLSWKARMELQGWTPHGFDSFFSMAVGIYISSTLYLVSAGAWKRYRRQRLEKSVLRPAFFSGMIYGVACLSYLMSMARLPYVVAYAYGVGGGLLVSQLWGTLFFGEAATPYNRRCVVCSFCIIILGVVLLAFSA